MGRHIVVLGNCQTGALRATLSAMLPQDRVDAAMWMGSEPEELGDLLTTTDVLVTSVPRDVAEAVLARHGSAARVIAVPTIYFAALHPDQSQFPLHGGGELDGVTGPYHSKIVVWGWAHGIPPEEILASFTPETYARLGYYDQWPQSVALLREIFELTDLDFASWYLPVVRRGAFMLTNNHPRLDALVQMARLVAVELGAAEDLAAYDWTQALPDGLLASGVSWPIYPGVGDHLDLPGAYAWRLVGGEVIGLERFVEASLAAYDEIDSSTLNMTHLHADPRFLAVLGDGRGVAAGGGVR